jgi:hypothetical protein
MSVRLNRFSDGTAVGPAEGMGLAHTRTVTCVDALASPDRPLLGARAGTNRAGLPEAHIPLFSEDWVDDSGYGVAKAFALPIKDVTSLDEIRSANVARYERGLAEFARQLAEVDRRTAAQEVLAIVARHHHALGAEVRRV